MGLYGEIKNKLTMGLFNRNSKDDIKQCWRCGAQMGSRIGNSYYCSRCARYYTEFLPRCMNCGKEEMKSSGGGIYHCSSCGSKLDCSSLWKP